LISTVDVARDHVLRRDGHRHRAQADADHPVDHRPQQHQPRTAHGQQPPEAEHHRALVLAHDPDAEDRGRERRDGHEHEDGAHVSGPSPDSRSTGLPARIVSSVSAVV